MPTDYDLVQSDTKLILPVEADNGKSDAFTLAVSSRAYLEEPGKTLLEHGLTVTCRTCKQSRSPRVNGVIRVSDFRRLEQWMLEHACETLTERL
jgi:hypothetical protein